MNYSKNSQNNFLNTLRPGITEGISLFTAVKNRAVELDQAIQTWITHKEIDEIIILDWGSDHSLIPLVEKYQNGKIILAVVNYQPKWVLSYAFNLAARLTTRKRILKTDSDVKILPGFFSKHIIEPGNFYCGNWRIRRNDNEMHLNGVTFLKREDFFRVNGYNEYIKFYGWDDSDLYQRLVGNGLNRNDFNLDTLYHIPHGNRTAHQDKPGYLRSIPDDERATFATFVNRHLGNTYGRWSGENKMLDFKILPVDEHILECKQTGSDTNQVPAEWIMESESVAVRERLALLGLEFADDHLADLSREELIELYNLWFEQQHNPASGHVLSILRKFAKKHQAE